MPRLSLQHRLQTAALILAVVALFVVLTLWGGVPRGSTATLFWVGIVVLVLALGLFSFVGWHLLLRPLPKGHKAPTAQPFKASFRQVLALLFGIAMISMIVGAFWDEIWHRTYGIPFGQDFFWRPHLLMYFGLFTTMGLGIVALGYLTRFGHGTFQQRFRANRLIGLMILGCLFLAYVIPADPIWHSIYGNDLSAWSIPHLLLFFSLATIMVLAAALQLSLVAEHGWTSLLRARLTDALPLLMYAAILTSSLQAMTTDWDHGGSLAGIRPDWVLPTILVTLAAVIGLLALHSLRRVGAATAVGLIALAVRWGLIQSFGAAGLMTLNGWLIVLAPLVAIDLAYAIQLYGARRAPTWWVGSLAAAAMIGIGLPLVQQLYPQVHISLPVAAAALILAALGAGWAGARLGDTLATDNKQVEALHLSPGAYALSLGALVLVLGFAVFFVSTAAPPV